MRASGAGVIRAGTRLPPFVSSLSRERRMRGEGETSESPHHAVSFSLLRTQHAQPEGTHEGANEGQTRCWGLMWTYVHECKKILSNHWKILGILAILIAICLIVSIAVPLLSSAGNTTTSNISQNMSRELLLNSSFSSEDLYWKSCHGVNVNISNQELSFKGSQDHCAKYQARLLDINSAKTIQDCIMDNNDYWIGQDCDLTEDSNCKVFCKADGLVQLHHSTERRFICTI
ncbi:uncharacterized protein LOC108717264 isoform X2 [Xenopus laevis]|uniref:Uncharacterized protein LOC108717264 isoform X2 n=1 Tax=Xenopus laevis TaxID=8355 RepID=A0A8J1KS20_XENLA|nr:uncharacterized protein LOC108717264 isoform X2 [Xenopus laevis]